MILFSSHFSPFRTKGKWKKKEKKIHIHKAMKKKKTLLRLSTKQGLKLCGFISNRTIIVFVQMTINGFC